MKKKTKTYFLLTTVVVIWGVLGFKVISSLNPEKPKRMPKELTTSFKPKKIEEADFFSIDIVKRDPFLGDFRNPKPPIKKHTKSKTKPIVWVSISYNGVIKKDSNNKQIFLISIDNQQHLIQIGQTVEGVTLIKGNEKEIVVNYKKHKKVVPIK